MPGSAREWVAWFSSSFSSRSPSIPRLPPAGLDELAKEYHEVRSEHDALRIYRDVRNLDPEPLELFFEHVRLESLKSVPYGELTSLVATPLRRCGAIEAGA